MVDFIVCRNKIAFDIWANSRLRTILRLTNPKDSKILDFGCGSGYFGKTLTKFNNDVYYLDISKKEIDSIDAPDDRKFLNDATKELPFEKSYFDWVFCGDLLEHLEDDRAALKNIFEVLKPGGYAAIVVPAHSRFYGHHDKLIGHLRRYDFKDFKEKLLDIGFEIVKNRYLCCFIFFPFLLNQLLIKKDSVYEEKSKIESKIVPLLSIIASFDSWISLPFGIGLLVIVKKPDDSS